MEQTYPKEGVFATPAAVALAKNGPNQDLGIKFTNEMHAPNTQALIARTFYLKPTNAKTVLVNGPKFPDLVVVDREYFTDNRAIWIERFEMEIAAR